MNGSRSRRWRGRSLSKEKPCPSWPIRAIPPACSHQRSAGDGRRHACWCPGPIARPQRILKEQMLDIGEQELLVLLLVLKAKFDHAERARRARRCPGVASRSVDPGIDMAAVRHDLVERGSRQKASLGPRVGRAHRLVVGVEQVVIRGREHAVAGDGGLEHERFEEPGAVREVPFRRTCVRHGLERSVFGAERRAQHLGCSSDRRVALGSRDGAGAARGAQAPPCTWVPWQRPPACPPPRPQPECMSRSREREH